MSRRQGAKPRIFVPFHTHPKGLSIYLSKLRLCRDPDRAQGCPQSPTPAQAQERCRHREEGVCVHSREHLQPSKSRWRGGQTDPRPDRSPTGCEACAPG